MMRLSRLSAWMVFFVALSMATAFAARDAGNGGPLRVDNDPNGSVLSMPNSPAVFPRDTLTVPVYLTTSNSVTVIENHINWDANALALIAVRHGEGVPDSMVIDVFEENDDTLRYKYAVDPFEDPFPVGSEPIAYLDFEVLCYSYDSTSAITFYPNNNDNFIVYGGVSFAPGRTDGSVTTAPVGTVVLAAEDVVAYAGQQDIPVTFTLSQDVPGKLYWFTAMLYDYTALEFVSVEDLPGLEGDVYLWSDNGEGQLILQFDWYNPVLGPAQDLPVFTVHFRLRDNSAPYSSVVDLALVTHNAECTGVPGPPVTMIDGSISVPAHTAGADIGAITVTSSATQYIVDFEMSSSFPIDDYYFLVRFPADQIRFVDHVGILGFDEPNTGVDTGDTNLVYIFNSSSSHYDAGTFVPFKLEFAPLHTPTSGEQFNLTFELLGDNEVCYDTDLGSELCVAEANLDLQPGYIKIYNGGGPGNPCCPALYAWNGGGFALENTILAECDGKRVERDVTDYYMVTGVVAPDNGDLRFQIREDAGAVSEFKNFELIAVDHPADKPIHLTREGRILTTGNHFAISWAKDYRGQDIADLIETNDNRVYNSNESGWFDVSFGTIGANEIRKFAAADNDALAKKPCKKYDAPGEETVQTKLRVSLKGADGTWRLLSEEDARDRPARQSVVIEPEMLQEGQELILRYSWSGYYRVDALDFRSSEDFDGVRLRPDLYDAVHNQKGTVVSELISGLDAVTLQNGEVIDLTFDASGLPAVRRGEKRSYIFVSTGHYSYESGPAAAEEPGEFALHQNVPNPFNPSTTIRYDVATGGGKVVLSIFDVRGKLVRTLVDDYQSAGEKSVTWTGADSYGKRVASGVYFYRLQAPGYTHTRKMVLTE